MANEPALDKTVLSFQVPVELDIKLKKEALRTKTSKSAFIYSILFERTKSIPLSTKDKGQIAQIIRKNQAKRTKKRIN